MTTNTETPLAEHLRETAATQRRNDTGPARDDVLADYREWVAAHPCETAYLSTLVFYIAGKRGITVGRDRETCPTHRALEHEVYVASSTFTAEMMGETFDALTADGWQPITEYVPTDGDRIVLRRGKRLDAMTEQVVRAKPGFGPRHDKWALLEPRKRTNGISLAGLCAGHRAYEQARAERRTRMNAPTVVVFKAAS